MHCIVLCPRLQSAPLGHYSTYVHTNMYTKFGGTLLFMLADMKTQYKGFMKSTGNCKGMHQSLTKLCMLKVQKVLENYISFSLSDSYKDTTAMGTHYSCHLSVRMFMQEHNTWLYCTTTHRHSATYNYI